MNPPPLYDIYQFIGTRVKASDATKYLYTGDLTTSLLKTHLLVEAVLSEAIEVHFWFPSYVKPLNLGYAKEVLLCGGLGLLFRDEVRYLTELNRVRNELAHRLGRTLTKSDEVCLANAVPNDWKKRWPDVAQDLKKTSHARLIACFIFAYGIADVAIRREHKRDNLQPGPMKKIARAMAEHEAQEQSGTVKQPVRNKKQSPRPRRQAAQPR